MQNSIKECENYSIVCKCCEAFREIVNVVQLVLLHVIADCSCVEGTMVFAQQISHLEISRALDFFSGNYRNLSRLFEISAGFGKSEQEISNLPSHSRIIWGGKSRKIEINLERKHCSNKISKT